MTYVTSLLITSMSKPQLALGHPRQRPNRCTLFTLRVPRGIPGSPSAGVLLFYMKKNVTKFQVSKHIAVIDKVIGGMSSTESSPHKGRSWGSATLQEGPVTLRD